MIELRMVGTESWLDHRSARRLSKQLGAKLWERCRGHRGVFVTLTYRREEYRDAQDLYRKASEEKHVALFLRKVGRYLKRDLRGKWFCKLEFQRGGWVHWHIILLDVEKIPHAELDRMWGRGFVWIRRMNEKNVRYCTKYTVKAGEVPAWLYAERPRSVKVVRVSSGFWTGVVGRRVGRDVAEEEGEPDPYDVWGPQEQRIEGVYVPVGARIDASVDRLVLRDETGQYKRGNADLGTLLVCLLELGCGVVGTRSGWLVLDATWAQLERAMERARAVAAVAAAARPLHWRGTGNRDGSGRWTWLDEWCWQTYGGVSA